MTPAEALLFIKKINHDLGVLLNTEPDPPAFSIKDWVMLRTAFADTSEIIRRHAKIAAPDPDEMRRRCSGWAARVFDMWCEVVGDDPVAHLHIVIENIPAPEGSTDLDQWQGLAAVFAEEYIEQAIQFAAGAPSKICMDEG